VETEHKIIPIGNQVALGRSSTWPNSYWNCPQHVGSVGTGNRVSLDVSTISQTSGDPDPGQLLKSDSLATLGEERYLVCETTTTPCRP